jgi:hypothetical protein
VVDINLRSPDSVQTVRKNPRCLQPDTRSCSCSPTHCTAPRCRPALDATHAVSRPLDRGAILQRIRAAFPNSQDFDATDRGAILNRGVACDLRQELREA